MNSGILQMKNSEYGYFWRLIFKKVITNYDNYNAFKNNHLTFKTRSLPG